MGFLNYNNVYGWWITTQYLRQIKENSKLNNSGFNKWLEILAGKELQTKVRKTENVNFKFRASNGTAKCKRCQLNTEDKSLEAATKYYNYTANKADEQREHRLPTFQQNAVNRIHNETNEEPSRGNFTVKINNPSFDATIGSKNYTICKIDMRSMFPTDWGQPITVLQ